MLVGELVKDDVGDVETLDVAVVVGLDVIVVMSQPLKVPSTKASSIKFKDCTVLSQCWSSTKRPKVQPIDVSTFSVG